MAHPDKLKSQFVGTGLSAVHDAAAIPCAAQAFPPSSNLFPINKLKNLAKLVSDSVQAMRKFIYILVPLAFLSMNFTLNYSVKNAERWDDNTSVLSVLEAIGDKMPEHKSVELSEEKVKRGYELVFLGKTTDPNGKSTKRQSIHYVCTDCHNTVREDPDLTKSDPEARLPYTIEKEIPFLQATTFKGIVNRETWYNGDYVKKYGSLVDKAHDDLAESIQVCSVTCSQGRSLEQWELDAIIAYYYSIQWTLGDLDLGRKEWEILNAVSEDPKSFPKRIGWLKGFYLQASPATFVDMPASKKEGYSETGNAEQGRQLYNQTCLHCHADDGTSRYLQLDNSNLSKKYFKRNINRNTHFSLYEIIRVGTHPIIGHKAYMPHYPAERMSNQQVENLRAYFESKDLN